MLLLSWETLKIESYYSMIMFSSYWPSTTITRELLSFVHLCRLSKVSSYINVLVSEFSRDKTILLICEISVGIDQFVEVTLNDSPLVSSSTIRSTQHPRNTILHFFSRSEPASLKRKNDDTTLVLGRNMFKSLTPKSAKTNEHISLVSTSKSYDWSNDENDELIVNLCIPDDNSTSAPESCGQKSGMNQKETEGSLLDLCISTDQETQKSRFDENKPEKINNNNTIINSGSAQSKEKVLDIG